MATFTWYYYGSAGPAWTDISTNTVVFSGTGGISDPVTVGSWNDEVHIGDGAPGTDQCGANHAAYVKYIATNSFDNGSGNVHRHRLVWILHLALLTMALFLTERCG